jgi:hypothetical protein
MNSNSLPSTPPDGASSNVVDMAAFRSQRQSRNRVKAFLTGEIEDDLLRECDDVLVECKALADSAWSELEKAGYGHGTSFPKRSTTDVSSLTFDDCVEVLRALARVPYGGYGEFLYPAINPLWGKLVNRILALDSDSAKVALTAVSHCRPKKRLRTGAPSDAA